MHARDTLRTIANELPGILRQIDSADPALRAAGRQRLADFAEMLALWRSNSAQRRVSRRDLLRQAGVATFAAMAFKDD